MENQNQEKLKEIEELKENLDTARESEDLIEQLNEKYQSLQEVIKIFSKSNNIIF